MTPFLEITILAALLMLTGVALLIVCRGHIHRQMDQIANAAKDRAFKSRLRFRPTLVLPPNHREDNIPPIGDPDHEDCAKPQTA